MKNCTQCKLPTSNFAPNKKAKDGLDSHCRDCRAKARREYCAANKELTNQQRRDSYTRNGEAERARGRARNATGRPRALKFGLTVEQVEQMHVAQEYRCAWCGRHESGLKKKLCIDHDRNCCPGERSCGGCVRRLLCDGCNTTEGQLAAAWPEGLDALNKIAWYNADRNVPNKQGGIENGWR